MSENKILTSILSPIMNLAFGSDEIDNEHLIKAIIQTQSLIIDFAKLAVETSKNPQIIAHAQSLIVEHVTFNTQLNIIEVGKMLSEEYDNIRNFSNLSDEAYTKQQIDNVEKTMELYNKLLLSSNAQIATFSSATLPRLTIQLKTLQNIQLI